MYNFEWEPEDGLQNIDEEQYRLAMMMAIKGLIWINEDLYIETGEDQDGNPYVKKRIVFGVSDQKSLCYAHEQAYTTEAVIAQCISKGIYHDGSIKIFAPTNSTLVSTNLFSNCANCIYGKKCIYTYAAYFKYLLETEQTDLIEAQRLDYNNSAGPVAINNCFSFTLPDNLMLDMPDEYLEVAELLQKLSIVSMLPNRNSDGELEFHTYLSHDSINQNQDLKKIRDEIKNNTLDMSIIRLEHIDDEMPIPNTYKLDYYAAYIDYLKKTGKFDNYWLKREAYARKTNDSFMESCMTTPGMEKILAVAETDKDAASSLYCIIEGERGVGKQQLVKNIANYLRKQGKLESAEYECMTMTELATNLAYVGLPGDYIFDDRNIIYNYNALEKRKLYVLTDVKEFLYKAENCTDSDGSRYSHLIKILGRYQPDTYVIIIGEKRPIERFLSLSKSIEFNFGRNIIHKSNLDIEDLYSAYTKRLSQNLQRKLEAAPEFKNQFSEYIEKNRRALPLENQELAAYLSNYANLQKKLILPPYAYQDMTANEMLQTVIGMDNVKLAMKSFEEYASFIKNAKSEGVIVPNSNLHMIFSGNPGTGKTMIARVVGRLLYELGLTQENKVIEVEPRQLIAPYIGDSAKKTSEQIEKAMGGVLFIDEAYAIGDSVPGQEAVATLIKAMEDHKDKLVVIFAGYEKEMQEFLNINSGISSRIGYTFRFEDYKARELTEIFKVKMERAGFILQDGVLDEVNIINTHFAGKRNFGNGRFVDKLIQRTISTHAKRIDGQDGLKDISLGDIPTLKDMISTDVIDDSSFEEILANYVGLAEVKNKLRQFKNFVEYQQAARKQNAIIPASNMHMVFTGNPGTGKTTIARIMVDLLYSIDIIKERKLVEVERKDLVGEHIGETARFTNEAIERAMNGVLFVDEAYSLVGENGDFGSEAIATLIKAMEDHKDELIVIFAGYKDEMREFLKINPGIESRIGNTFHFEDYTVDELLLIYKNQMKSMGFILDDAADEKIKNICIYFSKKKNFGNGRFVSKLVQETLVKRSTRYHGQGEELLLILAEDIPDVADLNNTAKSILPSTELDKIIGMDSVKEKMVEFERMVNFSVQAREAGITIPNFNYHMLFTGNPGTGKTTIARIITDKLFDVGLIKERKLVEVERKDLVAGYIGQTATKTTEQIEKAMGGVLFIDEAYSLVTGQDKDFGPEAIATLIKAMEDHKDDLIVIFAGYEDEMRKFVDSNPGIASRIGFTFHFDDYSVDELVDMFRKKMSACGFEIETATELPLRDLISAFASDKNFGNGRFVDKIMQSTILKHAMRQPVEDIQLITKEDIPTEIDIRG